MRAPSLAWLNARCRSAGGALFGAWAATVLALSAPPAHAEGRGAGGMSEPYTVAPTCPSQAAFGQALRARLPANLHAYVLMRELTVSIRREPLDAHGSFRYVGELGTRREALPGGSRSVQGASCEEVALALTLIGALSVEQLAESQGEGAAVRVPDAVSEEDSARPEAEAGRPRLGPVVFALLQSLVPESGLDLGLGVSGHWEHAFFQPWFMLGVYGGGGEAGIARAPARARLAYVSSHMVGCVFRFPSSGLFAVRPCLDFDIGRLRGEGVEVGGATRHSALWATLGGQLRFDFTLGEHIQVGGLLGGVLPLARPRFYFLPSTTLFEVDPLGLRAGTFISLAL
jgi:hypothetical protein